jgi:hypothetical protein
MTASLAPAILRYVPHHEIDRYLQKGWVATNDLADCYHGEFAVLMLCPHTATLKTSLLR